MDIQRGDQVYYRGEVWTVSMVARNPTGPTTIYLERGTGTRSSESLWVLAREVQRVEQVR